MSWKYIGVLSVKVSVPKRDSQEFITYINIYKA